MAEISPVLKRALTFAGALSVLFMLSVSAAAQVPVPSVFVGYSFTPRDIFPSLPFQGFGPERTTLNGWEVSLGEKIFPFTSIVADVGGYYGSRDFEVGCDPPSPNPRCTALDRTNANMHTFLIGPQGAIPVGRFTPFAHLLLGVAHISDSTKSIFPSNSSTHFSYAVGGGIDYRLIPKISWRVQADALQTNFFSQQQTDFRFSTGIVVKF